MCLTKKKESESFEGGNIEEERKLLKKKESDRFEGEGILKRCSVHDSYVLV